MSYFNTAIGHYSFVGFENPNLQTRIIITEKYKPISIYTISGNHSVALGHSALFSNSYCSNISIGQYSNFID